MADMYGAVRSNIFKVRDGAAFEDWFRTKVRFGSNIDLWELEPDTNTYAFGGYEQYPNAYPTRPLEGEDSDYECWNLDEFAREVRQHLMPGQEFRVLAAGNEKLRYVAASHLVITHTSHAYNEYYEGN